MGYPQYAKIGNKKYKINTDFRIAIKCNEIAEDENINDYKRALGIICLLYGKEVIGDRDRENYPKLLEIAKKYLACGKEVLSNNDKPDMDFIEDEEYIKSSFKYDYRYNPYELEYLHWYEFYNDLSNLSNSEFGDCCILSRVRNLRNFDLKMIKDTKEREKIRKAKQCVALKKYQKKRIATDEQLASALKFYEKLGLLDRK